MSLENLLKKGMIASIRVDKGLVAKTFRIAKRDLETTRKVLENDSYSWSLAIAYNSMLQAGRSLMFSRGFRPTGEQKHVAAVEFIHEAFGKDLTERMIVIFDRMRRKRHAATYDEPEIISEAEAGNAVLWAGEFISKAESILRKEGFEV